MTGIAETDKHQLTNNLRSLYFLNFFSKKKTF